MEDTREDFITGNEGRNGCLTSSPLMLLKNSGNKNYPLNLLQPESYERFQNCDQLSECDCLNIEVLLPSNVIALAVFLFCLENGVISVYIM